MNKYQEAYKQIIQGIDDCDVVLLDKPLDVIYELINRATPMKPKQIWETRYGLKTGSCPVCGHSVFEGAGCAKCLQAIGWNE